jgi:hypothetical protein
VRGFQRSHDLPVSGIVDARTASYMQVEIDQMEEPPPDGGGSSSTLRGNPKPPQNT